MVEVSNLIQLGLLGRGIEHSLSPLLQRLNGDRLNHSVAYHLYDFEVEQAKLLLRGHAISVGLPSLKDLKGLNVTRPYKELAYLLADEASEEASALRAANTLNFAGDKLIAHNTDPEGVKTLLNALPLEGGCSTVILLGTGGASRAAAFAFLQNFPCEELIWISRDQERAQSCLEWCRALWPALRCQWFSSQGKSQLCKGLMPLAQRKPSLLVSGATPLNEESWFVLEEHMRPILGERFGLDAQGVIVDLNYGEERLRGVRSFSRQRGINFEGGLKMLVGQGVASFNWWMGSQLCHEAQWAEFKHHLN